MQPCPLKAISSYYTNSLSDYIVSSRKWSDKEGKVLQSGVIITKKGKYYKA